MHERFAITAGTVVPMTGPPIDDGAVLVANGKIEEVLRRQRLPGDIYTEEYPNGILMPAFVNAHTHLVLTAFRGLADNADFFAWLTEHIIPLGLDQRENECRESARLGIKKCFRNGITTVAENHYTFWGRDAMSELCMKGVMFYEIFGMGTQDPVKSMERDREVISTLAKESDDRIRAGISPHAPYTVTPPMGKMAKEISEKLDLPISTHIAEPYDEVEFFLKGKGRFADPRRIARYPKPDGKRTSVNYFDDLGLLTPKTLLVHGVHLAYSDLDIIKDRGCTLVTCPTSNAKTGVGIARVGEWYKKEIPICIGTDSPSSGETFDLFEEMRRMVLFQRGLTGKTDLFSAESVIRMVTTNPAAALGMDDMVGDLRPGSCADMLLIEQDTDGVKKYRDVFGTLLWDITSENIVKVWADGREVYAR
jgi:cytosine/adenosine deaminase-related metal-dependent hydrolase